MAEYRLSIQGTFPGLNQFIEAQNKSRFAGAKMKKDAQETVMWHIRMQLYCVVITHPVRLEYRYFEPNRKRDKDNISGFAHKVIQDALVASGVIKNDGWKEIVGYSDDFFIDAKNPRIEVLIREVE